jgi:hypothetical protein
MKLISGIYGWIAAAFAALAGAAAIYLKGRSVGKQVEEAKTAKKDLVAEQQKNATLQKVNDVTVEVGGLSDADADKRLRDNYTRD